MGKHRYPPEVERQIVDEYLAGATTLSLASKYGLFGDTVRRLIRRFGIEPRHSGHTVEGRKNIGLAKRNISPETRERMRQNHRARMQTAETRQRISEALRERWKIPGLPENRVERKAALWKRWRAMHPERVHEIQKETRRRLRLEALSHYGEACQCCGVDEYEFLTVGHIGGLRPQDRGEGFARGRLSGDALLKRLKKEGWPAGFETLCWNCNCAAGPDGVCPHRRKQKAPTALSLPVPLPTSP